MRRDTNNTGWRYLLSFPRGSVHSANAPRKRADRWQICNHSCRLPGSIDAINVPRQEASHKDITLDS